MNKNEKKRIVNPFDAMEDEKLKNVYNEFSEFEIENNSEFMYSLPHNEELKQIFEEYQRMYPETSDPASYVRWDLLYTIAERWEKEH